MNQHGYFRVGVKDSHAGWQQAPAPSKPATAEPEKKGLLSKAVSWVKAEASLVTQGPLTDEAYGLRISQCLACDSLDRHPDPDKVGWCKSCGCGRKGRAELTVKGRMPKSTCPKGKWPKDP